MTDRDRLAAERNAQAANARIAIPPYTAPSRYEQLAPEARALLEDFDELDLAEMLVAAKNAHAAEQPIRDQLAAAISALGKSEAELAALRREQDDYEEHHVGNLNETNIRLARQAARAETTVARVRAVTALIRAGAPWTRNPTDVANRLDSALNQPAPAPICELPHQTIAEEDACEQQRLATPSPSEEDRLAQSGVDTPGCDCGHDGMGVSWHGDDCPWRCAVLDDTAPGPAAGETTDTPSDMSEATRRGDVPEPGYE